MSTEETWGKPKSRRNRAAGWLG